METKEDLLTGLKYVKSQISKILSVTEKQVNIVASFRETEAKVPTTGAKSTAATIFIVLTVIYMVFMAWFQSWANLVIVGLCVAYIYLKRNKKSKLKTFALIILGLDIFSFFVNLVEMIIKGNIAVLFIVLILAAATFVGIRQVIKMKNDQIEKSNAEITRNNEMLQNQYDATVKQLNDLKTELFRKSSEWYPKDYYSLDAVNFFINAIENRKADSIKEAVLLFDDSQYKNKMLASQQAIVNMNKQQLINQKEMITQLKFANVLNIANLTLQSQNMNAIKNSIAANTNAVNRASSQATNNSNRIIDAINRLK